jgi:hypothetical protein
MILLTIKLLNNKAHFFGNNPEGRFKDHQAFRRQQIVAPLENTDQVDPQRRNTMPLFPVSHC